MGGLEVAGVGGEGPFFLTRGARGTREFKGVVQS